MLCALPALTLPVSHLAFNLLYGVRWIFLKKALPCLLSALISSALRCQQVAAAAVEMTAAMPLLPGGV